MVGRFFFSFEILMTNSDSLFDLMVAGLLPISLVKLFSITHGLNVFFFSGSILYLKCVGYDWGFDLGDSSSPVRIWRARRLPTLLSACIFSITLFFQLHSCYFLPCVLLRSLQTLIHLGVDFFCHLCGFLLHNFDKLLFVCILFLCVRICGIYGIQRYLMVIRGYKEYMVVLVSCRWGLPPKH